MLLRRFRTTGRCLLFDLIYFHRETSRTACLAPLYGKGVPKLGRKRFLLHFPPPRDDLTQSDFVDTFCSEVILTGDWRKIRPGLTVVETTDDVASQCARGLRRGVLNDTTQVSPAGATGQHLVAWHWLLPVQGQSGSRKLHALSDFPLFAVLPYDSSLPRLFCLPPKNSLRGI